MALDNPQALPSLDVWTSALLSKSGAGRGSNGKLEAYGIKKLRELILELAVRGKLVPQNPNDEPASELLKQVAVDKAQMVIDGKIRKEKDFPAIVGDEIPFSLPDGWKWARINDVGHDWGQKAPDAGFTYIEVSAIDNSLGVISGPSVLSASEAPSRARKIVKRGTVIYSTVRPYLKNICVIEDDYSPEPIASTAFAVLHPFQGMPGKFFALYFRSPVFVKNVELVQTGIAYPAINDKQFYGGLVPIPPLAEQHRIVAKVDELMALCDQLEQQQTASIAAHQTLVEALLGTLTRVESQQEFSAAWARIASHFDTLFTTEASIDQLKQTLLQLAVMGKLVPQDPNDEPASVLLQRIASEQTRLITEGKISKTKPLPPVTDEEMQFDIPNGWAWARFDDLALHSEAGWSPNCESAPRQGDNWGVLKISAVTWGKYDPHQNKALPANLEPKTEFEVMPGDFLISRANTSELVARAVVVPNGAPQHLMMSDKIIRFVFAPKLNREYLTLVNGSELSRAYYARVAGGTSSSMKNVSREQIRNLVVALPPLAEQHRIVSKVDELMALCDALKARLADAQTTQLHLADTIVEQAVC